MMLNILILDLAWVTRGMTHVRANSEQLPFHLLLPDEATEPRRHLPKQIRVLADVRRLLESLRSEIMMWQMKHRLGHAVLMGKRSL
jgi:hypothetical protein